MKNSLLLVALLLATVTVARAQDPAADPLAGIAATLGADAKTLENSAASLLTDDLAKADPSKLADDAPGASVCKELWTKADTNGDGKISDEERAALRGKMEAAIEKDSERDILAKADADGNGELSDAEEAKLKENLAAHRAKMKDCREKLLAQYDANKDGKLDDDERAQLSEGWKKCKKAKHEDNGVRDHGKGEGRDEHGQGKGKDKDDDKDKEKEKEKGKGKGKKGKGGGD